jgi:WD40 repeat protein
VAPAGDRVAGIGTDGLLSVFDAHTGSVAYRTGAPSGTPLLALDWSPDGALLAAGGNDQDVYVFQADTGAPYDRLHGHADVVSAVAWSPDGGTLASTAGGARISLALLNVSSGPDQTIRLWTRR